MDRGDIMLNFRKEFLWLVFDWIQKNPQNLNDATIMAERLSGCNGPMKFKSSYDTVSKLALESLSSLDIISYAQWLGWHPNKKLPPDMTKKTFLKILEDYEGTLEGRAKIRSGQ